MSGIFLRWGLPALVTVVGGTLAAITTSAVATPTDLAAPSSAALAEVRVAETATGEPTNQAAPQVGGDSLSVEQTERQIVPEGEGSIVELPGPATQTPAVLPRVEAYAWRAQKAGDGTVTLTGYVPTEQLQRYLVVHAEGNVVDRTSLASGAPDGFIGATIAALDALAGLDDGAVSYSDGKWTLSGNVASTAKRRALEAALGKVPATADWQVAIQAADAPPVVSPFTWSAVKSADGYSFSGHLPTEQMRRYLAVRAGKVVEDSSQIGSGEPESFIPGVLAGLDALANLETGELSFDGKGWSVAGQPATAEKLAAVTAALKSAPGNGEGWSVALAEPLPQPAVEPPAAEESPVPEEPPLAEEPETAENVEQTQTAEATSPPDVPVVSNYVFEAQKAPGQPITFEGAVPAEAMRKYLAVIGGTEPSEALTVRTGLPTSFIDSANAGTRALALLADGQFGLDGDKWVFRGRAETDAGRRAALAALSNAPDLGKWHLELSLLPQFDVCKEKVGAFATRNAILFQSGSARITDASLPALDELAGDLAICPEVTVNVEGHTDGDGDASTNLALSVSRAEAVVDALILRGIDPERLYAIGYGESLPIASNDTRAGKQANRRIAFSLSED